MAYDKEKPTDDEYIAAGPAAIRENFRALKEDKIVDAGKVNGLTVGNESGDIPKANGIVCTNLNAEYLGGNPAGYFSPATHTHSAATTSSNGLMANTDKTKLDSIAAGAQVNQNAFASVLVGGTTIQADAATDTLELVAGSNVSLTPSATNDQIIIAVSGTVPAATTAAVCTGNAATATTLQTARTIGISGDATGAATSFNGSTNITIPVTLAGSGVAAGTYSSVTVDAKGRVTGGTNPNTISANTTGNAATATICTGNSATTTKLVNARTIAGVAFDGTVNIEIPYSGLVGLPMIVTSGKKVFTSSGTFTVPDGVTSVWLTMVAPGGGGGGFSGHWESDDWYGSSGGRGGDGGVLINTQVTVVPGGSIAVTIGAPGTAGTNLNTGDYRSHGTSGTSGGFCSFGNLASVSGGGGGTYGNYQGAVGVNGSNGNSFSGMFAYYGNGGAGGYGVTPPPANGNPGFILVEW